MEIVLNEFYPICLRGVLCFANSWRILLVPFWVKFVTSIIFVAQLISCEKIVINLREIIEIHQEISIVSWLILGNNNILSHFLGILNFFLIVLIKILLILLQLPIILILRLITPIKHPLTMPPRIPDSN